MFYYLVGYYEHTHDDGLGTLLSSMNPNHPGIFSGTLSLDAAIWFDWLEDVGKITAKEELSMKEALQAMEQLVKRYWDFGGGDLTWLIRKFKKVKINDPIWLSCVKKALATSINPE
jgi:hypothetical protein